MAALLATRKISTQTQARETGPGEKRRVQAWMAVRIASTQEYRFIAVPQVRPMLKTMMTGNAKWPATRVKPATRSLPGPREIPSAAPSTIGSIDPKKLPRYVAQKAAATPVSFGMYRLKSET